MHAADQGMDFRQCQLVVAFDPVKSPLHYIQMRCVVSSLVQPTACNRTQCRPDEHGPSKPSQGPRPRPRL
jgi:hypothetical protein